MQRLLPAIPLILSCLVPFGCRQTEAGAADTEGAASAVGRELEPFELPATDGRAVGWAPASGDGTWAATFVHAFQPDCLACQEHARALERLCAQHEAARVIGVAHRGTAEEIEAFRAATGVSYPLAVGAGSPWAARWGIGDPMYVVGRDGHVRYAQVGFHPDDVERWRAAVEVLAAGRVPKVTGPGRTTVTEGQLMPTIELPDLAGEPLRLGVEDGRLVFAGGDGPPRQPRAAVGFFSRY